MTFESWVDAQLREARERGEFDNLAGAGKPLPDLDGEHDEMWWIRKWLKRENVGFTPPAIALRKSAEDVLANVAKMHTEGAVRNVVEELNQRIRAMNRVPPVEGPPSSLMPLDVEVVVTRWRQERCAAGSGENAVPDPAPEPRARRRGLFRRQRQ